MKLWIQSGSRLGTDPKHKYYEQGLEKHFRRVARADTEIVIHGTKVFNPGNVKHRYDAYLHASLIIDAAIRAESEGYDAFVQVNTLDLGFYEIREAVSIPVIFPVETALHVATLLAPKVGFLVMNPAFLDYLNAKAKSYGFQERLTPGGCVNITPTELHLAFESSGPLIEELVPEAKKIGEQGANILICAGNPLTMLLIEQGVTELGGVRVLDSLGVVIKVAEMMVDLHRMGINRNGMGLYSPLPKEAIRNSRKLYGIE